MSSNRRFGRFADSNGSALDLNEQPEATNSLERADLDIFGGEKVERRIRVPDNALVKREDGAFVYKRFVIKAVGMEIPADATDDELLEVGEVLDSLESATIWSLADWFVRAERPWGMKYQVQPDDVNAPAINQKYQTLRAYASVARNVNLLIRNQQLSFAHHRLIAALHEQSNLQDAWLQYAAYRQGHRLTVDEMRREMRTLELYSVERQIQWLKWAISQPDQLLSQQSELMPPAPSSPPQIEAGIIKRQANVKRSFTRFNHYVQGKKELSKDDLQKEGRAIIEWIQQVMNS